MSLRLMKNLHQPTGPLHAIDEKFGSTVRARTCKTILQKRSHSSSSEFSALYIGRKGSWYGPKAWAYARLGDLFTERIPASALQAAGNAESDADIYISDYNIYMGHVENKKGEHLFPKDMILLSHWNLRDEIKANYNKGKEGLDKQRTVYEVMKRIIAQDIPVEVINSGKYEWNPYKNEISLDGKQVQGTPESTTRYQKMLNNLKTMQEIQIVHGNTYIDRSSGNMEVSLDDVEKLFDEFLSLPN